MFLSYTPRLWLPFQNNTVALKPFGALIYAGGVISGVIGTDNENPRRVFFNGPMTVPVSGYGRGFFATSIHPARISSSPAVGTLVGTSAGTQDLATGRSGFMTLSDVVDGIALVTPHRRYRTAGVDLAHYYSVTGTFANLVPTLKLFTTTSTGSLYQTQFRWVAGEAYGATWSASATIGYVPNSGGSTAVQMDVLLYYTVSGTATLFDWIILPLQTVAGTTYYTDVQATWTGTTTGDGFVPDFGYTFSIAAHVR